jgi:Thermolysin metallopeptidase, catalytic domain
MSCCPNPIHCILPPYILDRMAESSDPKVRKLAVEAIARSATLRATRTALAQFSTMSATPSPDARKSRLVYDNKGRGSTFLPGKLVRREGDPKSNDPAVNEAYDHAGTTYNFYKKVLGRNSLDDRGMTLVSSADVLGERCYLAQALPRASLSSAAGSASTAALPLISSSRCSSAPGSGVTPRALNGPLTTIGTSSAKKPVVS